MSLCSLPVAEETFPFLLLRQEKIMPAWFTDTPVMLSIE